MQKIIFLLPSFFLLFVYLVSPKNAIAASDLIENWVITSSIPFANASFASVVQGEIYILGGATNDDTAQVFKSSILNEGQINEWQSQPSLPFARYWFNASIKDNYAYILGGASFNGNTSFHNQAYRGTFSGGSLNSWTPLTPLPKSLAHGGTFISGNRLYFVGGLGSTFSDDIYSAEINPDGSIGAWVNSGTLPAPAFNMGIFEKDGTVYMLGGAVNGVGTKKVYKADLNSVDGSISGWQQLADAPNFPTGQQTVLVNDTFVFVADNKTYYSKILSPGVLDTWMMTPHALPHLVGAGRLVYKDGYLYLIGGHSGFGYLNTVYYAKFGEGEPENEKILNVNMLKQTDPLWSDEVYDSADKWASSNPGIGRWGCAMTSAAMVFDYHNITKLPDGSNLNPGSLNEWLRSQPDGYVGNGLINWIALTRLSKLAKNQNPEFDFEALEYSRINSDDQDTFKENIDNNLPTILGQPGHFIVGKGYSDTAIYINDPAFDREDLSEYANTFQSMGTYTPSNTDLSYLLITAKEELNIELQDSTSQPVGESYIQDPIEDPYGASSSAQTLKILYVEKPETENYNLKIQSDTPTDYEIDIYLYDLGGDVLVKKVTGVVSEVESDLILLEFNKDDIENSDISEDISFESLVSDIELYYELGNIKNVQTKNLLIKHLQLASKFYQGASSGVNGQLNALKSIITGQTPSKIALGASSVLIGKITTLQSTL